MYPQWGWGTDDGGRALELLMRFGSVTVLNGHMHQVMQKVEGNVAFHTACSTAFPQPAPGSAPSPGLLKVADDKLRALLGVSSVKFIRGEQRLAIIDQSLQGRAWPMRARIVAFIDRPLRLAAAALAVTALLAVAVPAATWRIGPD